jgi:hypothetical protein
MKGNAMSFEQIRRLSQPAETKILLMVMDGLGGLPKGPGYGTALEEASTPNMNDIAMQSICGLHQPADTGITPGSGPAHLALSGDGLDEKLDTLENHWSDFDFFFLLWVPIIGMKIKADD